MAAVYNFRHDPQGVRVALSEDLSTYDLDNEVVVFDAGSEATLGDPDHENFLAEHMQIGFGKPGGILLSSGSILNWFCCTSDKVTHTQWAELRLE